MDTKKRLFFITPIGADGSNERKNADAIIDNVLTPAFPDFEVKCSHRLNGSAIDNEILEHLDEDELVVADLTGLNPNVMYELAFRHSIEKPVALIALKGTKIPFDISHNRVIPYENSLGGTSNLADNIKNAAKVALEAKYIENPISIYRSVRKKNIKGNSERGELLKEKSTLYAECYKNGVERQICIRNDGKATARNIRLESSDIDNDPMVDLMGRSRLPWSELHPGRDFSLPITICHGHNRRPEITLIWDDDCENDNRRIQVLDLF
ncbi:MAG: hypothetical protein LBL79_12715 [Prevotella sp.]|jgi:hypothetical protein|nr:hypothetical protein [Prevotella sp.]